MAKLIRNTPTSVTSLNLNEISWVAMKLMMEDAPDATLGNIILYIAQCIDEQNINLKDYYATHRERKRKDKGQNQE